MERLDIILFGATGFTGSHAVKNFVHLKKDPQYADLSWGIAGRSKEKLKTSLAELKELGVDISKVPVIEADVKDEQSLRSMCQNGKVLMNCTGPNTVLSEPIVRACIASQTHYVDISAELHHMLNIYNKYDKAAQDANVLIVLACGFATLPVTAGLSYLEHNFNGKLQSVKCYTEVEVPKAAYIPGCNKCLVHYGTWESMIHELKNFREYRRTRNETFAEDIYGPVPDDVKKSFFHRDKGRVWFPYPGPEHDIVDMTQRYTLNHKGKKPYHFKIYTTVPLLIHLIIVPVFFLAYYLSYFRCFRYLLWKYPRLFSFGYMSHKGPSDKMRADTKFSFTLSGKGWDYHADEKSPPNKTLGVKISGADPGYLTTSVALLLSAITILKESNCVPKGGVHTTGTAFCDTRIVDRLNENVLKFEFVES